MDNFYRTLWFLLKDYVCSKNSHGKNELLEKMMRLEVEHTLKELKEKGGIE